MGAGAQAGAVAARIRRLGLSGRVTIRPYERDREALASAYRSARCVVMPGELETFGLVAFEAAASGASTVACIDRARRATRSAPLAHTFDPATRRACSPRSNAPARPSPTGSSPPASPPPTAGSARSPPSSPTSRR